MAIMGGATMAFARSIDRLRADFRQIRPTAFIAVPRVFELISATIRSRTATSASKQHLVNLTTDLGWRRFEASQGRGPKLGIVDEIRWQILSRVLAGPVLNAFGGRLRVAVSGGQLFARTCCASSLVLVCQSSKGMG